MRVGQEAKRALLTADMVREKLAYDPDTGRFTWLISNGPARPGKPAGTIDNNGYDIIFINGVRYRGQHLAWLVSYGVWPSKDLDHINGDRADNRISNLREADRHENIHNTPYKPRRKHNPELPVGVTIRNGKFLVKIRDHGKPTTVGRFLTVEEAEAAYRAAARRIVGDFCDGKDRVDWRARALAAEAELERLKNEPVHSQTMPVPSNGEDA